MKGILLTLTLLASVAEAQTLKVVCQSTGLPTELHRFEATGNLTVDTEGSVTGQMHFGDQSVLVKGLSTKFAAGEFMKEESQLMDLDSNKGSMRFFLGGPLGSSTVIMKKDGFAYRSTCQ